MKTNLTLLCLPFIAYTSNAQQDSAKYNQNKLHIGFGVTSVTYHIYYNNSKLPGDVKSGYFTPVLFNLGYELNDRFRLQAGLGYGGSKDKLERSPNHKDTDTVKYSTFSKTRVLTVPVTAQVTLFKAFKRFPVYGTASAITAIGSTKAKMDEILRGITTSQTIKDSGVNLFAIAGVGFSYKVSERLDGYVEWLVFKRNLTGRNSFHYDWEQYSPRGRRFFKSLGVGLNYKL